jgi:L(+)-tartrate dehydratase beta subunit
VAAVEVKEIVEAQWRNLGMPETLWHCHAEEFGPLIVSIEPYGRYYFEEKKVAYNRRKDEQVDLISKQVRLHQITPTAEERNLFIRVKD